MMCLPTEAFPGGGGPATPEVVRVGIASSLVRDASEPLVMALLEPFGALIEVQTGLKSKPYPAGSADDMARKLTRNELDFAMFQGIEFAWAKQNYPELRPLMIVDHYDTELHAYLLVRRDMGILDFADLKGKVLAVSKFSHEHCYQFMERHCRECGDVPERFFAKVVKPETPEDALDDVRDGKVQAAIIEGFPLRCYKRRKPGRFAALKVLAESEVFPASVFVCHEGALPPKTIRQFCSGMLIAPETAVGRRLLNVWRAKGFQAIPADYQAICTKIVKDYPFPKQAAR